MAYDPYFFADIASNVPTDNPWLLAQMGQAGSPEAGDYSQALMAAEDYLGSPASRRVSRASKNLGVAPSHFGPEAQQSLIALDQLMPGEATGTPAASEGLAHSEGGRAFNEGSPFSGPVSNTALNALSVLASVLGLPVNPLAPLSLAKMTESALNFFSGPFGTVAQTISPAARSALSSQRAGERSSFTGPRANAPDESTEGVGLGVGPVGSEVDTSGAVASGPTGISGISGPAADVASVGQMSGAPGAPAGAPGSPGTAGAPGDPTGEGAPSGTGPGSDAGAPGSPGSDYARGGRIGGKGKKRINAHGGEFVMNRPATQMFSPYIEAMNDLGLGKPSALAELIKQASRNLDGD